MKSSYGEQLLHDYLREMIRGVPERQVRPDWLNGLELDFYYPEHRLAFEFQGGQHYTRRDQKLRDGSKKRLCKAHGVLLIRIDAADLIYHRLARLISYFFVYAKRAKELNVVRTAHRDGDRLRQLNQDAIRYRKILQDKYDCPSARRKGSQIRRATLRAHTLSTSGRCADIPSQ